MLTLQFLLLFDESKGTVCVSKQGFSAKVGLYKKANLLWPVLWMRNHCNMLSGYKYFLVRMPRNGTAFQFSKSLGIVIFLTLRKVLNKTTDLEKNTIFIFSIHKCPEISLSLW